jgi:hypothetical protein
MGSSLTNMLGLSSNVCVTLKASYLKFFLLHYIQLYTTSHVVYDASLKAESHIYVSLAAVY